MSALSVAAPSTTESIAFVCATPGERLQYNWEYAQIAGRPECNEQTLGWAHAYAKSVVMAMRADAADAARTKRNLACCESCRIHEDHRHAIANMGADCACECER